MRGPVCGACGRCGIDIKGYGLGLTRLQSYLFISIGSRPSKMNWPVLTPSNEVIRLPWYPRA